MTPPSTRPAIDLVMPMAGRGSRFGTMGFDLPKPLIPLAGEPFFWWAVQSLARVCDIAALTCVVLEEHVTRYRIDLAIRDRFPAARLVILPKVTAGALETALAGCDGDGAGDWLVLNDCDHAFRATSLGAALPGFAADTAGFLCHFQATSAAYSYAAYGADGRLLRTVEKQPISDLAIAGAYGFRDRATFRRHAARYRLDCPYPELFISGVYNTMVEDGAAVRGVLLDEHLSFGTPDEYRAALGRIADFDDWRGVAAR